MHPGVAIVKNARRRLTCENASKRIHFAAPGFALLTPWIEKTLKIGGNRRCEVSTVGPAARRANSKCINIKLYRQTLPHFGLPSGSSISMYEWSSKSLKTHNFDHFLKCFLHWEFRIIRYVWWISWQLGVKLCRQKVRQIHAICTPGCVFLNNLCVTLKNTISEAKGRWHQYNFGITNHPYIQAKFALAGVQMNLKQGTKGTESGTVGTFYFSI